MAKPRTTGDLLHRVAFDVREEIENIDGNTEGNWREQFQLRAGYVHLRGGETVLAGRLQGQHSQVIFVRASALSRRVTTDWRVRDVLTGQSFNVRDVTPTDDRLWLDFLCQSGVADG
ncbi:head-tail adaptor protein [Rhizobium sp. WW_1]|jgi:head-tail adaptor|uniref:head-tail adaptor protein n=1 Tax=Rhizobium sp. WW_1 TaxID=1907375 RepID=UPI00064864AD|nr:head-tail adaptor protein [Rhizobium sp. WW_1]RKD61552.1 head-tail joining protein [Rhizobium sp. WW_1]